MVKNLFFEGLYVKIGAFFYPNKSFQKKKIILKSAHSSLGPESKKKKKKCMLL